MRAATLFLLLAALLISECPAEEAFLTPQEAEVMRIERLSQEQKYEEIFDSLGSEYKNLVDKAIFVKTSKRLSWRMTKTQIGMVNEGGNAAYAPVRCKTIIGVRTSVIDSVIFLVRENGKWRMWNLPFVNPELPDRPSGSLPTLQPKS